MIPKLWLTSALAAAAVMAAASSSARAHDWSQTYNAGVIGGAYGAGETIGAAAVSAPGYDGAAGGQQNRVDRSCYGRRPVINKDGTLIGYRGRQFC